MTKVSKNRLCAEMLQKLAASQPELPSYTFLLEGERSRATLTSGELDRRARTIGAALQRSTVQGDRALLLYPPGLEFIAAFFGSLYGGAIAVPAYPPRPGRDQSRLQAIVRDARPSVVLTTASIAARCEQLVAQIPELRGALFLSTDELPEGSESSWQPVAAKPEDLAFLQYTSGSTATPKGVMVSQGNLLHNQEMIRRAFQQSQDTVVVGWLPLYHDMGLIGNILQPLYVGGRCVLMSPIAFLQRPLRWLTAISQFRGTTSGAPNFAYDLCVRKIKEEDRQGLDLSSWRVAFNGAEPVRARTLAAFAAAFAPCGFDHRAFYPCYGLAEGTLFVSGGLRGNPVHIQSVAAASLQRGRVVPAEDEATARQLVSCGTAWLEQRVQVVHSETARPCASGEIGEIWVSGASVARGYWGRPEETERTFRATLSEFRGSFLRTGDLGYLDGGELYVIGRQKDLIIIRGRNLYPEDIEQTVEAAAPAIRRGCAAAFAVEGEDEERLIVACELERGSESRYQEVAAELRQVISSEYGVRVYEILFLAPGTIPKTSSGKIQRHACRLRYDDPVGLSVVTRSRISADRMESPDIAPELESSVEGPVLTDELRTLLAGVLGLPAVALDPESPLVAFGLDSLSAVEAQHGIATRLGMTVELSQLLGGASLREIAEDLRDRLADAAPERGSALRATSMPNDATEAAAEFPLSDGQKALWFLQRLDPSSAAYNIAAAASLRAELDLVVFERTLEQLTLRHEILRVAFTETESGPVQRIFPGRTLDFVIEDATAWTEEQLRGRLRELAYRPFDLGADPLLRITVLRRSRTENMILLVVHHIVADLWSLGILTRELGSFYGKLAAGEPGDLPALPWRYADYVGWQRERLASRGEELWSYWCDRLGGELSPIDLPPDRPRPPLQTFRGGSRAIEIPGELLDRVKSLGRGHRATLYATLLSTLAGLLHRYSHQEDLLLGSPTSGRDAPELAGLVGYFVNPVVLRCDLAGGPSFASLVRRVRDTTLAALRHQEFPFPLLVERLQPQRDPSRSPLFQVMFSLQRSPLPGGGDLGTFALGKAGARIDLGGWTVESLGLEHRVAQFDLELLAAETVEGLSLVLLFNSDLYDGTTAARALVHLETLLRNAVAHPDRPILELPILGESERQELLAAGSGVAMPVGGTFVDLFIEQARRVPGSLAAFGDGELTYADLDARSARVARGLRAAGVSAEQPVALWAERGIDFLTALVAILRAAGAYLPLDPRQPARRLVQRLEQSGSRLVLTSRALLAGCSAALRGMAGAMRPRVLIIEDLLDAKEGGDLDAGPLPSGLAYILFTSGSTGIPKGAMIEHRGLLNHLWGKIQDLGLGPTDCVAQTAAATFDISVWQFLAALLVGGRVRIVADDVAETPARLLAVVATSGVTVLETIPALLRAMLREIAVDPALRLGRTALHWLIPTGEALPPELCRAWFDAYPRIQLLNAYGPTECSDDVTHHLMSGPPPTGMARTPIGRPLANLQVHVLDPGGSPAPFGMPGEIVVAGVGVGRGYLGEPVRTAQSFTPNPLAVVPGDRIYRTGDLGRRLLSGELDFLGRVDDQVKIRGVRIELGEIEAALTEHPGVEQTVLLARPDPQGGKRLVAYWTATSPAAPLTVELREFLRYQLPEVMIPSSFVLLEAFPLTVNGKVDRQALPEPDWRGLPQVAHLAPMDELEALLASLFAEVLGLERIGTSEDFFAAGGHSLLATQVIARLRRSTGIDLPLRTLFEEPTVVGLAARVRTLQGDAITTAPPLRRLAKGIERPLSFGQERLWFLHRLEPDSPAYNMPGAVRLDGRLRPEVLAASLTAIVLRHESLRTLFREVAGIPTLYIQTEVTVALPVLDLRHFPRDLGDRCAADLAGMESRRPFDLARGPLLRALLLQLASEQYLLLVNLHHAVSDGWSQAILVREISLFYDAFLRRADPHLAELPIQYADFAAWQREWLGSDGVLDAQLAYWRERLGNDHPALELPLDRPRSLLQTFRGTRRGVEIARVESQKLSLLCRSAEVTPFMGLFALFAAALHRWSGQYDLRIGSPVANRRWVEIEGLIGFFVNNLVLRAELSEGLTLLDLLGQSRETALGAYAHQDVPFERLVDEMHPGRDLSRSPLFQAMFILQNAPGQMLTLPGLEISLVELDNGTSKFDLTLSLEETERGLTGWIEYNSALFDAPTIERFAASFHRLLAAGTGSPGLPVSDLPLLDAAERHQVVVEWNDREAGRPAGLCLHHLFEAQARHTPEAPALADAHRELTYRELDRRADRLASALAASGIGLESLVGVSMERSVAMVVAVLGILKTGAAYVPLDPLYPRERLADVVASTRMRVVLTEKGIAERLPFLSESGARLVVLADDGNGDEDGGDGEEGPTAAKFALPRGKGSLDGIAYIIFTSGSTGRPKGVQVQHRGVVNLIASIARQPGFRSRDTLLSISTLSFDIACAEIFLPLSTGGKVVLVDREVAMDGRLLAAEIERRGTTVMQATPATWRLLLDSRWAGSPRLRARSTGEALPRDVAARLKPLVAELWNLYGPTETTIYSSAGPVDLTDGRATLSLGWPIDNTWIGILDRQLAPLPVGVPGEIYIGGEGVARGYLNRPDLTAERFVPAHLGSPAGGRLYRTGDLGRHLPEGQIEYLGRADQQVKVRGFRIELQEIEIALAAQPAVGQAVVAARDLGQGDRHLVAYVVPAADHPFDPAALRTVLTRQLPEYMLPSLFMALEALPLTPSGKVDRRALPDPGARQLADRQGFVAPRNAVEAQLATIWQEVLGATNVGIDDDFFALGGHSLVATRVIARIVEVFAVDLPLRSLFEARTVAGLAQAVGTAEPVLPARIRPVPRDRVTFPLSSGQARLWLIDQLQGGNAAYNITSAVRLSGPLDAAVLALALAESVRRHETLRTTFQELAESPVQLITPADPAWTPPIPLIDLSGLADAAAEMKRSARAELGRPFDLRRGPLLRVTLLRLESWEHVLLIAVHHIVADGLSLAVLLRETQVLYPAFSRGLPSPLPDLPLQYVDFVAWQLSWLETEKARDQRSYWKRQLGTRPPILQLPGDRPRPAVQTFRGGRQPIRFDPPLVEALRAMSRGEGVTLFVVLLSVFETLLHRLSSQDEILVGTAIANRNRVEIQDLIGFFVNTLVLRGELQEEPAFRTFLHRMQEVAVSAYANQDLPFGELVQELQPERDLGYSPVFQAAFGFQGLLLAEQELAGLRLTPQELDGDAAMFDLTLDLMEGPGSIDGWIEYSSDLFDPSTVERYVRHLAALLQGILDDAGRDVWSLPLMSATELDQLLDASGRESEVAAPSIGLHQLFEQQVALCPDAIAVVSEGQELTYAELDRQANRLARHLISLGVGPAVLVGLLLERSPAMLVAILGVLKAGGAYVPIDLSYPPERQSFIVDDAQLQIVVTESRLQGSLFSERIRLIVLDEPGRLAAQSRENPRALVTPDDLAYVIYTSGSTGRPKGVCVRHHNVTRLFAASEPWFHFGSNDIWTLFHSYAFDFSVWEIWGALLHGGRLVVVPYWISRSAPELCLLLARERVTVLNQTPSAFGPLIQAEAMTPDADLSLREVIFGGESLNVQSLKPWWERHGDREPRLVNMYGITETTVHVTYRPLTRADLGASSWSPIGVPLPDLEAQLLDRRGWPVPLGVPGELCIGGAGLARGYLFRPELDAERFIPRAFGSQPGARLYRSGDLVRRLPGGELLYLGRIDHQVKVRGFRIEIGEIESVLAQHAGVRESVVLLHAPSEEDRRLVAYLVPDAEQAAPVHRLLRLESEGRLNGHVVSELPNHMPIFQLNRSETEFLFEEIYSQESYLKHGISLGENACVFDVGANIGLFTLFIGQRFPDASIYSFEPIPATVEVLRLNTDLYGINAKVFDYGLAGEAKSVEFTYYPNVSVISGYYADLKEERQMVRSYLRGQHDDAGQALSADQIEELLDERLVSERVVCQLLTLSEVIRSHRIERIDLLKVDVEKSEMEVLAGIEEADWEKIHQVVIEVHDANGALARVQELLARHGFFFTIEQEDSLQETGLYNIYARKEVGTADHKREPVPASSALSWGTPRRLLTAVRDFARVRLPEYMMPTEWVLVPELPLTPNGKVDRTALAASAQRVATEERALIAPRNSTEESLALLWAQVLGVDRVGVADNFFDLGGHSLLATRLVWRIRELFGVELQLRALFESPTVETLARSLATAGRTGEETPPPLVARERPVDLPLSFAQQRLWFLQQLDPLSVSYHIPAALRLDGALVVSALAGALGAVVGRHEALRTRFVPGPDAPRQQVLSAARYVLPVFDLSPLDPGRRQEEARRLAREASALPFDLGQGPLLRAELLCLDRESHLLILVTHHIISDGWSMDVLVREAAAFYRNAVKSVPSPLPALPIQYADFALWQRRWLSGAFLERQVGYWRRQLLGAPQVLDLPTDHPRQGVGKRAGASLPSHLNTRLVAGLVALSRRESATLFMTVLTGLFALLSRYTEQEDLLVGSPIANRTCPELEPLIGFFVNTLVLRGKVGEAGTPQRLLAQVRETALEAYAHQDLPFEKLVEELSPERSLEHTPLFQVLLVLQNAPAAAPELPGMRVTAVEIESPEAQFDWTLTLVEERGGLHGSFSYRAALWDAVTVQRVLAHFEQLLTAMAETPESSLVSLSLLAAAERQQLLEWNATAVQYPPADSLSEELRAQMERTPDAVAVVFGEALLSYRELAVRARRLAAHLSRLGVRPDMPVGICVERSPELVVGLLAILAAGGAYVPIDPSYPRLRLAHMLEDSKAPVLLTQRRLLEHLPAYSGQVLCLDLLSLGGMETLPAKPVLSDPDSLAYMIYTSGSTGTPKGAMNSHRAILNRLFWMQDAFGMEPRDVVLQKTPTSFDVSVWELFWPLLRGARLILARPGGHQDPLYLARLLGEQQVTTLHFVPAMLQVFLESVEIRDCGALRRVICSGEALPQDLADRYLERIGGPVGAPIYNLYGPTEAAVDVTWWPGEPGGGRPGVPIGRPIANLAIHLLSRSGRQVPIGVAGELYIGGRGLARGYWGRPDLTAERFVPDPLAELPGGRLYWTGDLARYRSDGAIEFLGRVDHQVKVRGLRIELEEVESALSQHPGVGQTVVVVREVAVGDRRLVAYLVPSGPVAPTSDELSAALLNHLPEYMVPAAFVSLAALPLTPSGKVDRRALPAPEWGSGTTTEQPRTQLEDLVAGVWEEILGIDRIGTGQNFFALGGHSLLATRVVSRLREALGVELSVRSLFEAPTVRELARQAEVARGEGAVEASPPIRPRSRARDLPLSFAQERMWFLDQLNPLDSSYNVPVALALSGSLRVAPFAAALNELVRRHEALRTTFRISSRAPIQVISPALAVDLPWIDLAQLGGDERQAELARLAAAEAGQPFDLARGPLLRARMVRLASAENVLLFTLHHIVTDAWSNGIVAREVAALYEAFATGRPSPLPELPLQYADYALWQREWLSGEVLEGQIRYWRSQLAGIPARLELPTDRPRPAVQRRRGGTLAFTFPPDLADGLLTLSRRRGATLFMSLLAAFAALLDRYSGQEDVVIGSPIAGRNHSEVEGLIGLLLNTLALRIDVSGNPSFDGLLRRTRGVTLDGYAYQDLPFEKLVAELAPERNLSHSPIFQVVLVLQNAPMPALEQPGLTVRPLEVELETSKFDLTLNLTETTAGLVGWWLYDSDLFDPATIERLLGHYRCLLGEIVVSPDESVTELPLLTQAELAQLDGFEPAREFRDRRRLEDIFVAQASRRPEAVAVVDLVTSLSYGELDRRSNRLARRLRRLGVGPEALVGLCFERSSEMVVGILGILKAGGAYLPLDPSYPEDRLRFLLTDAGPSVLVTDEVLASTLPSEAGSVPQIYLGARWLELADESSAKLPAKEGLEDSLAYVIYTSGSTGRPKGSLISHSNVTRLLAATGDWFGFGENDTWTVFHSFSFDFSVWEIFGALLSGGRLVVVPFWVSRTADAFYELLGREQVTVLNQTPSAFRQIARAEEVAVRETPRPSALRWIIFGGEALDLGSLGSWFERHGDERPQLVNMYGITETTVHVTFRPVRRRDIENTNRSPLGVPIPDLRIHLLDRRGHPVPLGIAGEICVGGAGVARGYLGRPDLTAERFVPDPWSLQPGGRLYASGDLARRRSNGDLEYLGRADSQVKIRGFRIELGEIESALSFHPEVDGSQVLALKNDQGDLRLVAYFIATGAAAPTGDELRAFLKERLPEHMIPAFFLRLDAFPLTRHGKIDRRALPAPEPQRFNLAEGARASLSAAETILTAVWAEVLGLDRIGIHDNFFTLGGDSILSLRARSLAERRGIGFSLQQIFQHQTIAELVPHLSVLETGGPASIGSGAFSLVSAADRSGIPEGIEDAYPLSLLQLGMFFHSAYAEDSVTYLNVTTLRLRGTLDLGLLRNALDRLAARHPVLRTSFDFGSFSEPLQLVHREAEIPLSLVDLRLLSADARTAAAGAWLLAERERKFDGTTAPLLRFHVHLSSADEVLLSWSEHHAILDGWSVASLLSELLGLYRSERSSGLKGGTALEPLLTTFRDFVALEREAVVSPVQRRYWEEALSGVEAARLEIWPSPRAVKPRDPIVVTVPRDVSDGLKRLAAAAGVPIKSVLLAAHLKAISRLLGQAEVVTGMVVNGRPEAPDADRVLGLFLNTVPLRRPLPKGTWTELAVEAFQAELELLPFRRFPLAELRRLPGVDLVFDTCFNYTHFHVLQEIGKASELQVLDMAELAATNFALTSDFALDLETSAVSLRLQYDNAQVSEEQIQAIAGLYQRVLAAMATGPDGRIDARALLADGERQQLLVEWNDTQSREQGNATFHETFEVWAETTPTATAVVFGGEHLSYRELNGKANRLARRLRARGVGPDVLVGLCCERSAEMLLALLAVLKAGGAYLPLDPSYPTERLAFLLADAQPQILLVPPALDDRLPDPGIPRVWIEDTAALGELESETDPPLEARPENLAYVLYTSGSTGRPKGVMIPHRGLANYLAWARESYGVGPTSDAPVHSPLGFDLTITGLLVPLYAGGRVTLLPEEGGVHGLATALAKENWGLVKLTPSHLEVLDVELEESEEIGRAATFVIGGEALTWENLGRFRARAPQARLINEYGPTETVVGCCTFEAPADSMGAGAVPIGRPIAGTRLYLLDLQLQPAPLGAFGELYIGGEGLARGYLGRPDLTAERFLPNPFSTVPGARLYRSGDRGVYLLNGNLKYLGRGDDLVKIRGFRIEPGEIEAWLVNHPAVSSAVILARSDDKGALQLVAYLAVPGKRPSLSELRDYLRVHLPEPMLPTSFVFLEQIPLTANGKVDRRGLLALAPATGLERPPAVPPRDEIERELAEIWRTVLGVARVGATDDFLDLGGHSLAAVRIMAQIERSLGVRLPLATLFLAPTIEQLALRLRQRKNPTQAIRALVPLQVGGSSPGLYLVHPVGGSVFCYTALARALGPQQPVYAFQSTGGEERSLGSIEDMAASYLREMLLVQPEGPYFLGGWSLGGVIAFEMARQLAAMGRKVGLLAIFDSLVPIAPGPDDPFDDRALLAGLAQDLAGLASSPWELPNELSAEGLEAGLQSLLTLGRRAGTLPGDIDLPQLREMFNIFRHNLERVRRYIPRPYAGPMSLFRAQTLGFAESDPTSGWSALAPGVDLRIVAGDHYSILREPHVREIAEFLLGYISKLSA